MLRNWEDLPAFMRIPEVRPYWEQLNKKKTQLGIKRLLDFLLAFALLIILAVPMIILSIWIKIDSRGPVFFRQDRVTAFGTRFRIFKFRTMVYDAEKKGTAVTVKDDKRITKAGKRLRRFRLDELPQLFNVLQGTMSFVGTRPEAVKYVEQYKPDYMATLLLPAGVTSEASLRFKDEDILLDNAEDVDRVYIDEILPRKMKWNLKSIREFKIGSEIKTMVRTIFAVFGKDYDDSLTIEES
jgi:lipopolysaccharide/colanic/teichoic acid biosynthesis glycosyltransferase